MNNSFRHCEERQRRGNLLKPFWIASLTLAMTTFFFAPVSLAEDKTEEPTKELSDIINETILPDGAVRHAPENCEFEITFPSAPYTAKRCTPVSNAAKDCAKLTSYTMVYDITTTIEVSVTCVPSTPEQYKRYTESVIATALSGMVSRAEITEHEINTREEDNTRQGSLLGSAKRGKQQSIYNAQLLIGQNSIMTVEAKLIGPFHAEADTVFSEILASLKKK